MVGSDHDMVWPLPARSAGIAGDMIDRLEAIVRTKLDLYGEEIADHTRDIVRVVLEEMRDNPSEAMILATEDFSRDAVGSYGAMINAALADHP